MCYLQRELLGDDGAFVRILHHFKTSIYIDHDLWMALLEIKSKSMKPFLKLLNVMFR